MDLLSIYWFLRILEKRGCHYILVITYYHCFMDHWVYELLVWWWWRISNHYLLLTLMLDTTLLIGSSLKKLVVYGLFLVRLSELYSVVLTHVRFKWLFLTHLGWFSCDSHSFRSLAYWLLSGRHIFKIEVYFSLFFRFPIAFFWWVLAILIF